MMTFPDQHELGRAAEKFRGAQTSLDKLEILAKELKGDLSPYEYKAQALLGV